MLAFSRVPGHRRIARVLDIGSGVWRRPGYVADRTPRFFVGIDPLIPDAPPDFTLIRALGERIPLDDGTLDAVLLATSLDHAIDVPSTLAEVRRVLAPHGIVYFWGMWVPEPRLHGDVYGAGALERRPERDRRRAMSAPPRCPWPTG